MTPASPLAGRRGSVPTALRWTTRALQAGLVALLGWFLLRGDPGLVANALAMLAFAAAPDVAEWRRGYDLNAVLRVLFAASALLHVVGILGPYRTVVLYDQVAHAVTASLVAGGGYVFAGVVDERYEGVRIPPKLRVVFVVVFVTAFGVLWEIFEFGTGLLATVFGGEPLLAQHGLYDVVLDLAFDAVGAVLVALWGTQYFEGVRRPLARHFDGFG